MKNETQCKNKRYQRLVILFLLQYTTTATNAFVIQPNTSSKCINAATRSRLFRQYQPKQKQQHANGNSLSIINRLRRIKQRGRISINSDTSLHMVLTTPSSIIEQASTKKLLDDLIDESVRTTARTSVMMQFDPSSGWIWRRWKGTVFSETWRTCVINMLYASVITLLFYINKQAITHLFEGFNVLWGQLLSVTTFTLTFFLNQSYALWRNCYGYSRRLQGRLNDLNMAMASHAKRVEPEERDVNNDTNNTNNNGESMNGTNVPPSSFSTTTTSDTSTSTNEDESKNASVKESQRFSTYTEPAREVLELMARYTRVFNLFTYASFTRSHRPLLTPQGMKRLVDRGVITESERLILSDVQLPVTQRHNALLLWMMRLFQDARKAGHLDGGNGFEQQFLEKCHVIRAQYGAIGDELQGRMPMAYAHIVQVLVDVILWMYPIMAFSTGMTPFLSVIGTGLLTMFYEGLFNLAKQFLDPYDNESYGKGEDPLCIDTLIAESNAGSVRWMNGLAEVPYNVNNVQSGNLLQYQLPLRGWTIEQTTEMELALEEEERLAQIQKEADDAEKKLAEEAGLVEPIPILEVDEDVEELMRGDEDEECTSSDEDLTMEEALEKMEECTEKVP
jgi:hypothetical protein